MGPPLLRVGYCYVNRRLFVLLSRMYGVRVGRPAYTISAQSGADGNIQFKIGPIIQTFIKTPVPQLSFSVARFTLAFCG
jgi:hypothetical protein